MRENSSRLTTVLAAIAVLLVLDDASADDPTCGPDAGSCYTATGTPGCDCERCCKLVCGIFPFCCDDEWDQVCANIATEVCVHLSDCHTTCSADVSGDGVIDLIDMVEVIESWGTSDPAADVTGDGIVDVQDLVLVITNWGPCG